MVAQVSTLVLLLVGVLVCVGAAVAGEERNYWRQTSEAAPPIRRTIEILLDKVLSDQVKEPSDYVPFWSDQKLKGIFPSYIHVNFHGDEIQYLARRYLVNFFDNNHFVTNWVLQVMLETHQLGVIRLNETRHLRSLQDGIALTETFKDKNFPDGTAQLNAFLMKNDFGNWMSWPTNIGNTAIEFEGIANYFAIILDDIGLPGLAKDLEGLVQFANLTTGAFRIPADFDDTAVNVALGARLRQLFPQYYSMWQAQYPDMQTLADKWVQYSYDPFSNDSATNSIDPRTYYWLHGFVEQEHGSNAHLRIITTWAMNVTEDVIGFNTGDRMPFNVNNVDASVCANGVLGLSLAALNLGTPIGSLPSWFTPELIDLHLDTAKLLAWTLQTNVLSQRPDLVLLYYPPVYDFYWFVARTVFALSYPSIVAPYPELLQIRDILTAAMQKFGTAQILDRATVAGSAVYWDDFLGDNDTDIFGQPYNRGEDRLFSTAVAINALLDTWSFHNGTSGQVVIRSWRSNTPANVKSVVANAISWLNNQILSNEFAPENAFFSGSMKGMGTGVWFYPANRIEFFNGTKIDPRKPNSGSISASIIDCVSGFIQPGDYQHMLTQKWFGVPVPTHFESYNSPDSSFPYWSSPTFTHATAMLALAKYVAVAAV